MPVSYTTIALVLFTILFWGCKKDGTVFENNTIPPYGEIPTIKVQNYVNRLFIDILGREPVDIEMAAEVEFLENSDLSRESRLQLVSRLMSSDEFVEGDSTYRRAYYVKLYEDTKARMMEGASDSEINSQRSILLFSAYADSLAGDLTSSQRSKREARKLKDLLDSREELMMAEIGIREFYQRMADNAIYDVINMNSFNFINATYNDLFFRYPTDYEFEQAYSAIEYNLPGLVLGQIAQNEGEYLDILTASFEFDEGMIRWCYQSLLAREPTTQETYTYMGEFSESSNLSYVQSQILITDEYAGFD